MNDKHPLFIANTVLDDTAALFQALEQGDKDIALQLIENGNFNINATESSDNTALHLAVENGFKRITERLVNLDADINAPNNHGFTPLMIAVLQKHLWIVQFLLGQDDLKLNQTNINKNNALDLAEESNNDQIILAIRTAMYIPLPQLPCNLKLMQSCLTSYLDYHLAFGIYENHPVNLCYQDNQGNTAMHYAAKFRCDNIFRILLKKGSAISITNNCNKTPLDIARAKGLLELVELAESFSSTMNNTFLNALRRHCQASHSALLVLNNPNVDANSQFIGGEELLDLAYNINNKLLIRKLLDNGATHSYQNSYDL